MDYDSKKDEYKERGGETKYYFTEVPEEKQIQQLPITFNELFYNIPKGGSIAVMPEFHEGVVYFPSLDTHFYALNAATGEMLWKFKMGGISISAALVHNGKIYFGSHDGNLYCLDLNGRLLWKKYLGDIIISYTAAIGGKIFTAAGRTFFCLSEDGTEKWRFVAGDGIFTSPTAVNGIILISSYDKHIYAIDIESGSLRWKFPVGGPVGTPLVFLGDNPISTLSIRSMPDVPEAKNPVLYFASLDNNLYALNEEGNLLWKFNSGNSFATVVTASKGTLYCGTVAGYLYAIELNGQEKWKFRTGGLITAGATPDKGKVYIGSWDQKLYCLSDKGEKIWDFLTGGPIAAESIVVNDRVYFGSADTFFYCLNTEKRTVEWTFQCGFGMPDLLKTRINQIANTFTEYDRRIFRVWKPETTTPAKPVADMPAGFRFGGDLTYFSSSAASAYKSSPTYLSKKRKPYDK